MKVFLAGRIAVEVEGVAIDERHFPGRQGRLLFAYLVVADGRPVPRDELTDVLWGDAPPPTSDKALSVLVSKLRGLLAGCGVDGASALTAAFGCYQLDLPDGTWVDVLAAENAAKEAEGFLEMNELESATAAAGLAESVTRSPFLPGDDAPWVEEKRRQLAEVRARALSTLAHASLRTDRAAEAVRWAGLAVEAEPFRESGYRTLMEAHVAAGNRGEALQVYERCRRLLAEELGAYPSPETDSVYRGLLDAPVAGAAAVGPDAVSPPGIAPSPPDRRKPSVLAAVALLGLVLLVAAGTAIAVVATRGDNSRPSSGAPAPSRVALVVPRSPPGSDDPSTPYRRALDNAERLYGIRSRTFKIDLRKPGLSGLRGLKSIRNFGLVVLAGQLVSARFVREMGQVRGTRFVVVDPDPNNQGALYRAVSEDRKATDVFFVEGPGAYLAGYLGGLMLKRADPGKRVVLSVVASDPTLNENTVGPFARGARSADHHARVLTDYAGDSAHPWKCRAIANSQIDKGAAVVFADAGGCSSGALDTAETRNVWGIGADQDQPCPESENLASTMKLVGQEVDWIIENYLDRHLPQGHLDFGIERDVVGIGCINPEVPKSFLAKLASVTQHHRKKWASMAMPLSANSEHP